MVKKEVCNKEAEFIKATGRPSIYDKDKHIKLLYKTFKNEEGVMAFCADALITKPTFYNWMKEHEEFRTAYDIAISIAGRQWEKIPRIDPSFNYPYWQAVMKNRYGYFKVRVDTKENDLPADKIETIWKGLREGELSTQEAVQLASIAVSHANILNNSKDEDKRVEKDTEDGLQKKLALYQAVLASAQHDLSKEK